MKLGVWTMSRLVRQLFQSLKGHQPKWNRLRAFTPSIAQPFQSLKGHQPKWNGRWVNTIGVSIQVSIPKRASAKVKQIGSVGGIVNQLVSIPKRASAKVKPQTYRHQSKIEGFQSLKGHQPKWNFSFNFQLWHEQNVSIPKRASAKVKLACPLTLLQSHSVSIPKRASAKVKPVRVWVLDESIAVSIPKRASAKVKRYCAVLSLRGLRFQSLKGHQPKWNPVTVASHHLLVEFQSLKGHQPKWN